MAVHTGCAVIFLTPSDFFAISYGVRGCIADCCEIPYFHPFTNVEDILKNLMAENSLLDEKMSAKYVILKPAMFLKHLFYSITDCRRKLLNSRIGHTTDDHQGTRKTSDLTS